MKQRGFPLFVKRAADVLVASGLLAVSAPVLATAAVAVRSRLGSPVFFRQQRPGLGGRPFSIIKLRTMSDERDAQGALLPDGERLPPLGRWLRSWSIDELPQLVNVLAGDLSLVGPRPLLMEYLPRYTKAQRRRHDVLPGITGWAQVHGRNAVSWEERFALDTWYVDQWSPWLDAKILWMTCRVVLRRQGISASRNATMPKFQTALNAAVP